MATKPETAPPPLVECVDMTVIEENNEGLHIRTNTQEMTNIVGSRCFHHVELTQRKFSGKTLHSPRNAFL